MTNYSSWIYTFWHLNQASNLESGKRVGSQPERFSWRHGQFLDSVSRNRTKAFWTMLVAMPPAHRDTKLASAARTLAALPLEEERCKGITRNP